MESGTPILPMSCSTPARRSRSTISSPRPSSRAIIVAYRATVCEWRGRRPSRAARGAVDAPDRLAHGAREQLQRAVAGRVAEAVVHRLEVVEIDREHAHGALAAARALELELHQLVEPVAVEELGERIGARAVGNA